MTMFFLVLRIISFSLGDCVLVRFCRIQWSLFISGSHRVLFTFLLEFAPEIRGGGRGLAGRLKVEVRVRFGRARRLRFEVSVSVMILCVG
jgi:hypothetical protein